MNCQSREQQEFVSNEGTKANPFIRKRIEYSFLGSYEDPEGKELRKCPVCGALMHKNGTNVTRLRHLPFGDSYTVIEASRVRYRCTNCEHSEFIPIGFKTEGHLITEQLKHYTESFVKNHESDPSISCEVDPSFVHKNQDHLE